jgi:arabinogalactan endo-1,4-beta-galactosidase
MKTPTLRLCGCVLTFLIFFLPSCTKPPSVIPPPTTDWIKGADMSFLQEVRASGKVFYNREGVAEDMLQTLRGAGANTVRLKLWYNPATQEASFATVKALAAEVRAAGLKLLLTVHYSDTWADPAHQAKPQAWQSLGFEALQDSVSAYTAAIMREIKPDYIQIGNEINDGFLWEDGRRTNAEQFKTLLQKGIAAVRAHDANTKANTKIVLHFAGTVGAMDFFEEMRGLDYDLIGVSYYPLWHGSDLLVLEQTLRDLGEAFGKSVFIAETSYPFSFGWNDWTNNVIGSQAQILPDFAATPEGQKAYFQKILSFSETVPNVVGACYWGAAWVSYNGDTATNGSTWENQAFWDFEGRALPILEAFY